MGCCADPCICDRMHNDIYVRISDCFALRCKTKENGTDISVPFIFRYTVIADLQAFWRLYLASLYLFFCDFSREGVGSQSW